MYPTPQLRRSQRLQQTPLRNEIRLNDVVGNSLPNSPSLNKRRAIPARPLTVGAGKPATVYGDRNVFLAEAAAVEGEEDATPLASARGRPRLDETPSLQRLLLMDTPQHLKTLLRRFTPRSTYGHATEHELTVPSSPLLSVSRENMEEAVVQSASVHNGEPSSLLMAVLCFCLAIIAMPLYFAWSNVHLLLSLGHFLCIRPLSYLLSFSRPSEHQQPQIAALSTFSSTYATPITGIPRRGRRPAASIPKAAPPGSSSGQRRWWVLSLALAFSLLFASIWLYSRSLEGFDSSVARPTEPSAAAKDYHSRDPSKDLSKQLLEEQFRQFMNSSILATWQRHLDELSLKLLQRVSSLESSWSGQFQLLTLQMATLKDHVDKQPPIRVELGEEAMSAEHNYIQPTLDYSAVEERIRADLLPQLSSLIQGQLEGYRSTDRPEDEPVKAEDELKALLSRHIDWAARHMGTRVYLPGTHSLLYDGGTSIIGHLWHGFKDIVLVHALTRPTIVQATTPLRMGECYRLGLGGHVTLALPRAIRLGNVFVEHLATDSATEPQLRIVGRPSVLGSAPVPLHEGVVAANRLVALQSPEAVKYVRLEAVRPGCLYRVHLFSLHDEG